MPHRTCATSCMRPEAPSTTSARPAGTGGCRSAPPRRPTPIPVAEYTLAMILLANKNVLQLARIVHTLRAAVEPEDYYPQLGNFRKRVGSSGPPRSAGT